MTAAPGPFTGLRVLELADEKGQFAGKLLADLGADVIKIEPPGGEPCRRVGPFVDDIPNPDRSLSFWYYNTSKRGITLDLDTADGQTLFRRMAANADVILETRPPGYMESRGLDYQSLRHDRLIMCSLTPFGQTGPWRDFVTSDLLHMAAGGEMASCGYDETDVPDAPPIAPGGGNAWHMGSHYATMAIMAALVYRSVSGHGQYIDASIHEACALTTERAFLRVLDGSCRTPIAGHARIEGGRIRFRGLVLRADGSQAWEVEDEGHPDEAEAIGIRAGRNLLERMPADVLP